MRRLAGVSVLAFVALTPSAVSGCAADATGHPTTAEAPTTLTLAFTGSFADAQIGAFESEASAESGGVLTVSVSDDYSTDMLGVEQKIIQGVAAGDLDLGWVGVRAFSELGVHEFDPLIAPFVLDSLAVQDAVLDAGLPQRMLPAVEQLGVVGLAVVPGALRRPIAASAPLLALGDFAGIPFYSWHGDINAQSVAALGAVDVDLAPPERNAGIEDGSIRAYENTLDYLASTVDRQTRIMTADIALWPSVGILIANPGALAELSDGIRDAVARAATATAEGATDLVADDPAAIAAVCAGGGSFAVAGEAAAREFRAAEQPVYDAIRADPAIAMLFDDVLAVAAESKPDVINFPADCAAEH